MDKVRRLLCTTALFGLTGLATAAPDEPKEGVQYLVLPQARNTDAGNKVEVIEFFAYYCPHCYAFEPLLSNWVKKQGENIVFRRVHVPAGPNVLPQQRLFYTLEALGLLDQYHGKVFAAMHEKRQRLASDEQVFDWAASAGIDRARFIDAYRSFGLQARLNQAASKVEAYHVDYWPQVAIDGRFITSPSQANQGAAESRTEAQQQEYALKVMDYLVAKAKAAKK
ncbi:thiol:disulfide interchange protein DsbA/DsbL [Massilia horti]|uniref:Thiol:disulfide interchange protein n=1 Tax=Massilia horti TaxID=2562153 RepID=A0A4Y9STI1_9BURK|nr:thiol:disulfide interchange protein DsbA/DsbL [Massilia horti]TFW29980.1 thiol:disulfide interchange protein DsbA/DsbL [Massilia horti]